MKSNKLVLFDPREAPIRGMFSFPDPSALSIGEWAQLTNIRPRGRAIVVRNGYDDLFAFGEAGTFRGCGVVQLTSQSNNPFYLAGLNVSSKGEIWAGNTGSGISERTANSGQYGDTRFDNGTSYMTFAPLAAKGAGGLYPSDGVCVVQDGSGYPRIYDSSTRVSGSGHTAIHRPITLPTTNNGLKTIQTFPAYFTINSSGTTTYTNSSARLALSESGTSPANDVRLATTASVANGDTAIVAFSGTTDLSASRQLVFLIDDKSAAVDVDFWSNIKVEIAEDISGTPAYSTVYDGTAVANNTKVEYQPDVADSTLYWIAFPLDHITSTSRDAVNGIRFTWTGATRPAAFPVTTLQIMAICGSGKVGGGCLHGISYFNSGSWAESPGIVIAAVEQEYIKNLGGFQDTTAASSAVQIPDTPLIYVTYTIQFQNTDATELARGVDYLRIYRKDQQFDAETNSWGLERDWGHTEDKVIATYAASTWSLSSGTASGIRTTTDTVDQYAKDYTLPFPPGTHLPVPSGHMMLSANRRLFVAGFRDSSADPRDTLWISARRNTSRFNRLTQFVDGVPDIDSPTSIRFPGEIIQGIVASSTSTFGQSQVYVITDKSVYALREPFFQVAKIGDTGTLSPFSIVENRGRLFFVDSDMVVRKFENGSPIDLSSSVVDDKLRAVPDAERGFITGTYWRDSYRLAFAPSAGANTSGLIFDESAGMWYADTLTVGAEQFLIWRTATGTPKLCFFSAESTPSMYEHEQDSQTDDNGTAIAVTLTTGEIHDEAWNKIFFRKGEAIVDDNASGTLTWTRTYPHTGSTGTSTMSIDVSTTRAWRQDGQQTISGAQGGPSAQLSITGNMLGGKKIRFLSIEVEGMDAGPDR